MTPKFKPGDAVTVNLKIGAGITFRLVDALGGRHGVIGLKDGRVEWGAGPAQAHLGAWFEGILLPSGWKFVPYTIEDFKRENGLAL